MTILILDFISIYSILILDFICIYSISTWSCCMHMSVRSTEASRSSGLPEAGVIGYCEPPNLYIENYLECCVRAIQILN